MTGELLGRREASGEFLMFSRWVCSLHWPSLLLVSWLGLMLQEQQSEGLVFCCGLSLECCLPVLMEEPLEEVTASLCVRLHVFTCWVTPFRACAFPVHTHLSLCSQLCLLCSYSLCMPKRAVLQHC